ncbi:hypothetical protein [Vibrio mediterranei]|uniref:hypothetical protein n=1 Tax=Vibrio mediterranei TaxID=689 RepID=UPI001EFCA691|nr:hypothetical protein [Vibrio mediterranei]MCG9661188.1 hypothetical protein [Vibrio mediterranei]
MYLYKVTYLNEFRDEESKELLLESDVLADLENYALNYAKSNNVNSSNWQPLGLPTMGDNKLKSDPKKRLKISDKEYLLLDVK